MKILETVDSIVEAITNCKDPQEKKDALKIVVAFALHDASIMTNGVQKPGLPNQVTLSLLMVSVQNMAKPRKEAVKSEHR